MSARILVTGPRDFDDDAFVIGALERLEAEQSRTPTLVVGDCPEGVDRIATDWANAAPSWRVEVFRAAWDDCVPTCPPYPHRFSRRPGDIFHPGTLHDYCPGAGPRRNGAAVASGAGLCLAVIVPCTRPKCATRPQHGTHGTADCIRQARRAGIPIHPLEPAANTLF